MRNILIDSSEIFGQMYFEGIMWKLFVPYMSCDVLILNHWKRAKEVRGAHSTDI